ncbi:hypothetical protein BKA62DRAFT_769775 [Auriculariales sp. MPI-PUGE-AT-0066]|nr:hypothetical protein BKA62DRAFT_769775 [Auriculariales sp. MPI-PUGE-AT-0066]
MSGRVAAQAVIQDIRSQKFADDELDADMRRRMEAFKAEHARALVVLSDDLYTNAAHCIFEIIQNAVDNTYSPGALPTLEIELWPSFMQIWCNEMGFTEKDVRGFCSVGDSSKRNNKEQIGEKGIGAKSMFKVAVKVIVQSGDYSFYLDRGVGDIGMTVPVWYNKPFPLNRKGWSSIRLEFGDNQPFEELKQQLVELREGVLLFLPKLAVFKVNISGDVFSLKRTEQRQTVTLVMSNGTAGCEVTESKKYLMVSTTVSMSQREPKREGQTSTVVKMAFPLNKNSEADNSTKASVHAFLPLRRVGFKFSIHGDFLTAANREDVRVDNPWNITIRDRLVEAFMSAINVFKTSTSLRFTWPLFLPKPSDISDGFFSVFVNQLLKRLKTSDVIRCSDGSHRPPSRVRFAGEYVDRHGVPLIADRHFSYWYAATEYSHAVTSILKGQLGVADVSFSDFVGGLIKLSNNDFNYNDSDWLNTVFQLLIDNGFNSNYPPRLVDHRIGQLPLAEREDGIWESCSSSQELFFARSNFTSFPSGISIRLLSNRASTGHSYTLLSRLGVKELDTALVVEQIIKFQGRSVPTLRQSVEQLLYLYKNSSASHEDLASSVWLYDRGGRACRGSDLYMDEQDAAHADRLSFILLSPARFVHEDFIAPTGIRGYELRTWRNWLHSCLGIATSPRVHNDLPSTELKAVVDRLRLSDTRALFSFLRKYWPKFSSTLGSQSAKFCDYFRCVVVRCRDGTDKALSNTFLPSPDLMKYPTSNLPLLNINDPGGDWSFLTKFGVSIRPDGLFFLKQLIILSSNSGASTNMAQVMDMYEQIDSRFVEMSDAVCEAFDERNLIFVKNDWHSKKDVLWSGPSIMTIIPALNDTYPTLKRLFQERLRIQSAGPEIVAKELQHFANTRSTFWMYEANSSTPRPTSDFSRLYRLLAYASGTLKTIQEGNLPDWTPEVRNSTIFPVVEPNAAGMCTLVTASDDFYVADVAEQLRDWFAPHVGFMALKPEQVFFIAPLLRHFSVYPTKCIDESISISVKIDDADVDSFVDPDERLDKEDTDAFNDRLVYFKRYVYWKLRRTLPVDSVRVFNVEKVAVTYSLKAIHEHVQEVDSWVQRRDKILDVFLTKGSTDSDNKHTALASLLSREMGMDTMICFVLLTQDTGTIETLLRCENVGPLDPDLPIGAELEFNIPACPPPPAADSTASHATSGSSAGGGGRGGRTREQPEDALRNFLASTTGIEEMDSLAVYARDTAFPAAVRFAPNAATGVLTGGHGVSTLTADLENTTTHPTTASFSADQQNDTLSGARNPDAQLRALPSEASAHQTSVDTIVDRISSLDLSDIVGHVSVARGSDFDARALQVGFLGEKFVYDFLCEHLPNFDLVNWTSELRHFGGLPAFRGVSYADFQYHDHTGTLTRLLLPHETALHGATPEVFIEVKSTSGSQSNTFFIRRQQFRKAFELRRDTQSPAPPQKLYVLFRVSQVGLGPAVRPEIRTYVDPHALLVDGNIVIESSAVEVRIVDKFSCRLYTCGSQTLARKPELFVLLDTLLITALYVPRLDITMIFRRAKHLNHDH